MEVQRFFCQFMVQKNCFTVVNMGQKCIVGILWRHKKGETIKVTIAVRILIIIFKLKQHLLLSNSYKRVNRLEVTIKEKFNSVFPPENADPPMECFDENVLKFKNGKTEVWMESVQPFVTYRPNGKIDKVIFSYKVVLPADLVCDHCVLQVKL